MWKKKVLSALEMGIGIEKNYNTKTLLGKVIVTTEKSTRSTGNQLMPSKWGVVSRLHGQLSR